MATKRKNKVLRAIAVLLIAVILCMISTRGFQEFNPYCWFGHDYKNGVCIRCNAIEPIKDEQKSGTNVGGMIVGDSIENDIKLLSTDIPRSLYDDYGISQSVETAKQLTAIFDPLEADVVPIDWHIAWKDATSSWASGKTVTDYVTVTPTFDGSLTANVSCLQAFGEQIYITVSVRENSKIVSDPCTVDYKQRYFGTSTVLQYAPHLGYGIDLSTSVDGGSINVSFPDSSKAGFEYPIEFGTSSFYFCKSDTFTIPVSVSNVEYYLKLNEKFVSCIETQNSSYGYSMTPASDWVKLYDIAIPSIDMDSIDMTLSDNPSRHSNFAYYLSVLVPELYVGTGSYGAYLSDQYLGFCRAVNSLNYNPYGGPHFQIKIVTNVDGEIQETITDVKLNSITIAVSNVGVGPAVVF